MRLIDADALADALFEKRKNYPQWVADTIGGMPTIDVDVLLKEQEPVEPELEGGGSSWWHVCGECHGMIDKNDLFCRHCGRRVKRT